MSEVEKLGIANMVYIKVPGGIFELMSTEKNTPEKIESLTKHVKMRYENLTM